MIRNRVKLLRTDDQIQIRQAINQRRAAILRHAAQDANLETRLLPLALRQVSRFADRLLLRLIAHATGIEQNHVCIELIVHHGVTAIAQGHGDLLAVPLVHLTSVGFNIDAIHGK